MILALDPATRTGVRHEGGLLVTWDLSSRKTEHPGMVLDSFRKRLHGLWRQHPFTKIASEDASFGSPNPQVQAFHNQLRGVIYLVAYELGSLPVVMYKPTSIKKYATGSGKADKRQVVDAAWEKLGLRCHDDNQADAAWVLEMCKNQWTAGCKSYMIPKDGTPRTPPLGDDLPF